MVNDFMDMGKKRIPKQEELVNEGFIWIGVVLALMDGNAKKGNPMKVRTLIFFPFFFGIVLVGCKESKIAAVEKQAQIKLANTDWETRKEGVDLLLRVEKKDQLSKRTTLLLLKDLEDEIRRKHQFIEMRKADGKSISQIEKAFDEKYPRHTYGDYVVMLANLAAEERPKDGLPLLFKFLIETDYMVSPVLPTVYKEKGFKYLLEKASQGLEEEKKKAIHILSLWVNPPLEAEDWDPTIIPKLTLQQKERVLPLLMDALEMDDLYIVYCATAGLEPFLNKSEVKEKLMQIETKHPDAEIRSEAKRILQNATE